MMDINAISCEMHDAFLLARIIVQRESGRLTDAEAITAPLGLELWGPDRPYDKGQKIRHDERMPGVPQLYEVMQDIKSSIATQPPDADGMLAVYRPIVQSHAGTIDDPIPYVYGMDCKAGLYYIYLDAVYLCNGDMIPGIWPPGTSGMWQWEVVK